VVAVSAFLLVPIQILPIDVQRSLAHLDFLAARRATGQPLRQGRLAIDVQVSGLNDHNLGDVLPVPPVANGGPHGAGPPAGGFPPGHTPPTATLSGLDGPGALAFDAQGNLFVTNAGRNGDGTTVSGFVPGSTTPTATLSGLNQPFALAFDPSGNLFVANASSGTVSKFTLVPAARGVVIRTAQ